MGFCILETRFQLLFGKAEPNPHSSKCPKQNLYHRSSTFFSVPFQGWAHKFLTTIELQNNILCPTSSKIEIITTA